LSISRQGATVSVSTFHTKKAAAQRSDDTVLFTNMDYETFKYRVEDDEMLKPAQVADMVQSHYDMSLYTCSHSGNERFTVRC